MQKAAVDVVSEGEYGNYDDDGPDHVMEFVSMLSDAFDYVDNAIQSAAQPLIHDFNSAVSGWQKTSKPTTQQSISAATGASDEYVSEGETDYEDYMVKSLDEDTGRGKTRHPKYLNLEGPGLLKKNKSFIRSRSPLPSLKKKSLVRSCSPKIIKNRSIGKSFSFKKNQYHRGDGDDEMTQDTASTPTDVAPEPKKEMVKFKLVHVTITALTLSGLTMKSKKKTKNGDDHPIAAVLSIAKNTTSSERTIFTHVASLPVLKDPMKAPRKKSESSKYIEQHLLAVWPSEKPTMVMEESVEVVEALRPRDKQLGALMSSITFNRLIGISRSSGPSDSDQCTIVDPLTTAKRGIYDILRPKIMNDETQAKKKDSVKENECTYIPSLVELRVCIMRGSSEILPIGVVRVAVSGEDRDDELTIPIMPDYYKSIDDLYKDNLVAHDQSFTRPPSPISGATSWDGIEKNAVGYVRFQGAKKEAFWLEPNSFLRVRLQVHSEPLAEQTPYPAFNPGVTLKNYVPKGEGSGKLSQILKKKYQADQRAQAQLESLKSSSPVVIPQGKRSGQHVTDKNIEFNQRTEKLDAVVTAEEESSFGSTTVSGVVNPLDQRTISLINTHSMNIVAQASPKDSERESCAGTDAVGEDLNRSRDSIHLTKQSSNDASTSKLSVIEDASRQETVDDSHYPRSHGESTLKMSNHCPRSEGQPVQISAISPEPTSTFCANCVNEQVTEGYEVIDFAQTANCVEGSFDETLGQRNSSRLSQTSHQSTKNIGSIIKHDNNGKFENCSYHTLEASLLKEHLSVPPMISAQRFAINEEEEIAVTECIEISECDHALRLQVKNDWSSQSKGNNELSVILNEDEAGYEKNLEEGSPQDSYKEIPKDTSRADICSAINMRGVGEEECVAISQINSNEDVPAAGDVADGTSFSDESVNLDEELTASDPIETRSIRYGESCNGFEDSQDDSSREGMRRYYDEGGPDGGIEVSEYLQLKISILSAGGDASSFDEKKGDTTDEDDIPHNISGSYSECDEESLGGVLTCKVLIPEKFKQSKEELDAALPENDVSVPFEPNGIAVHGVVVGADDEPIAVNSKNAKSKWTKFKRVLLD